MISIHRCKDGILMSGHANYAEPGKDIVCAAVSVLVQNLIQSIEELTIDQIKYVMSPGTVDIEFRDLSEHAQLLVNSFFVGIEMIASEYPDNVKVTKH